MITRLRANHGTVVAYVALFAALGTGGAYAANQVRSNDIAKNAIKSKHIKNGQVKRSDIVGCPRRTSFHNGLCWDRNARPATSWFAAGRVCAARRGRLPLATELFGVLNKPGLNLGYENIAAETARAEYSTVGQELGLAVGIHVGTPKQFVCVYDRIR